MFVQEIGGLNGGDLNLHRGASLAAKNCCESEMKMTLANDGLIAVKPAGQAAHCSIEQLSSMPEVSPLQQSIPVSLASCMLSCWL